MANLGYSYSAFFCNMTIKFEEYKEMHKHHLDVSFMHAHVINFEENLAFQNMYLFGRLFVLYKKGLWSC